MQIDGGSCEYRAWRPMPRPGTETFTVAKPSVTIVPADADASMGAHDIGQVLFRLTCGLATLFHAHHAAGVTFFGLLSRRLTAILL
jgi:hypothetical protein